MSTFITYSDLQIEDFSLWLDLGLKLWPDSERAELKEEFEGNLKSTKQHSFIAKDEQGHAVGFINVSIRQDYVAGATQSPTGYIEGLYVVSIYRKRGVAKKLMGLAELWASEKGCTQMGSDTWESNTESQAFHQKIGFVKKAVLVHFIKDIVSNKNERVQ